MVFRSSKKLQKPKRQHSVHKGAKFSGPGFKQQFLTWFRHHQSEIKRSLKELLESPGATIMSMTVLAIALALPAGLQVALKNSQQLSQGFDNASRITLYIHMGAKSAAVETLSQQLSKRRDLSKVQLINPEEGLKEFEQRSGFGDALQYLGSNPLPYVIILTPSNQYSDVNASQKLLLELQQLPLVDKAQLDLEWVKRLQAIMTLVQQGIDALALLFGVAVLLIVGNTIRLAIHSHRDEIKVVKLVGATNGFIRRPFLYTGIWYGLGGALLAWFMVVAALAFLESPVEKLSMAYGSGFQLQSMAFDEVSYLLFSGMLLGWLGAWISVSRHIREIEPG